MQNVNRNSTVVGGVVRSSGFYCDICDQSDLVPSVVTLEANYGSKYDGERVTLMVCGDCMDWLRDSIAKHGGEPKRITDW